MTDIYNFLNAEEEKMLGSLNLHILAIKKRQMALVREAAKREGVIAENLEDLKSQKGESFREEKSAGPRWGISRLPKSICRQWYGDGRSLFVQSDVFRRRRS